MRNVFKKDTHKKVATNDGCSINRDMLAHCFFPLKLEISRKCESEQIELDNKNASKKKDKS